MKKPILRAGIAVVAAGALVGGLSLTAASASAAPTTSAPAASSKTSRLTNLAHLDFLLDTTTPTPVAGHTTYRLASEPAITFPWTYANIQSDGSYQRVGGGSLDPVTGHWQQGSYNADDDARAAVVYLRDWQQTGSKSSEQKAYELLRSVAYLQVSSGPNSGNIVLWMQPDGTLNPSAIPADNPDPSDSGASYWQARSLWAFGEGYADFTKADPAFAAFLKQRLDLGIAAVQRESLSKYGTFNIVDGQKKPAWLITDGADASAEASLGLSAYVKAAPSDRAARTTLTELAKGIALMGAGDVNTWPYGAILPFAESLSMWHAWGSRMPEALATASTALHDSSLLTPAIADSTDFATTLLTDNGPDNAWYPTAIDQTQIAYGADSRLESLLAVATATHRPGIQQLAGLMGAWFFGANKSGTAIYSPANGVTFDGVASDGSVNRNSGAESTIHGLLAMLALDANPAVAQIAEHAPSITGRSGLSLVEGENATTTTGTVITPTSAWTGESQFSGGKYLQLTKGQTATIDIGVSNVARMIEPVVFEPNPGSASSAWAAGKHSLGALRSAVGAQGISAVPGALLPQTLSRIVPAGIGAVTVTGVSGTLELDAVLVRPVVSTLSMGSSRAGEELVAATSSGSETVRVGQRGERTVVRLYDAGGRATGVRTIGGPTTIRLRGGGFAVASW